MTSSLDKALGPIEARLEKAAQMVNALCQREGTEGARDWIMSIPARRDYDPDFVIGDALLDMIDLLTLVRAQAAERDALMALYHARTDIVQEWQNIPALLENWNVKNDTLNTLLAGDKGGR